MPKEVIYGDELPFGASAEDSPGRSVVEVSWSREGEHVQIASKCVLAATEGRFADDDDVHYTDGFYVNLDRQGINRTIRTLRRARDQAYGRDE